MRIELDRRAAQQRDDREAHGAVGHAVGVRRHDRQPLPGIARGGHVAERRQVGAAEREQRALDHHVVADRGLQLRQEQQRDAQHPGAGRDQHALLDRGAEEDPGVDDVQEDDGSEEHCDQAARQVLRREIGEPVVQAEQGQSLDRHEAVVAPGESQRAAGRGRVGEDDDGRQPEAVDQRYLGCDDAELELDRVPGGAPDEDDDGVNEGCRHPGHAMRITQSNQSLNLNPASQLAREGVPESRYDGRRSAKQPQPGRHAAGPTRTTAAA
ncbi:MAG TPA: hypothetical protein VD701_04680 [Steroidobacteraceae bacterium]|nr:hypothetical protein [Steroidobacteraceae bacterium]